MKKKKWRRKEIYYQLKEQNKGNADFSTTKSHLPRGTSRYLCKVFLYFFGFITASSLGLIL